MAKTRANVRSDSIHTYMPNQYQESFSAKRSHRCHQPRGFRKQRLKIWKICSNFFLEQMTLWYQKTAICNHHPTMEIIASKSWCSKARMMEKEHRRMNNSIKQLTSIEEWQEVWGANIQWNHWSSKIGPLDRTTWYIHFILLIWPCTKDQLHQTKSFQTCFNVKECEIFKTWLIKFDVAVTKRTFENFIVHPTTSAKSISSGSNRND